MKTNALLILLIATSTMAGCTGFVKTAEISDNTATPVASERLFAYQTQQPGYTKLTITRDAGLLGSGCFLSVEIGRTLAARLDPGEIATFYIKPGTVELSVAPDPQGNGLCGPIAFTPVRRNYEIPADKTKSFRLSSRMFRRPALELLN